MIVCTPCRCSQWHKALCGTEYSSPLCFKMIKLFSQSKKILRPKWWYFVARLGLKFMLGSTALVWQTPLTLDDKYLVSNTILWMNSHRFTSPSVAPTLKGNPDEFLSNSCLLNQLFSVSSADTVSHTSIIRCTNLAIQSKQQKHNKKKDCPKGGQWHHGHSFWVGNEGQAWT